MVLFNREAPDPGERQAAILIARRGGGWRAEAQGSGIKRSVLADQPAFEQLDRVVFLKDARVTDGMVLRDRQATEVVDRDSRIRRRLRDEGRCRHQIAVSP